MSLLASAPQHSPARWVASLIHDVAVTSVAVVGLLDIADAFLVPRVLELRNAVAPLIGSENSQVVVVMDARGQVLPDFTLRITSLDRESTTTLLTNVQGIAAIPHLAGGEYAVHLRAEDTDPVRTFRINRGESNAIVVTVTTSADNSARRRPARHILGHTSVPKQQSPDTRPHRVESMIGFWKRWASSTRPDWNE